MKKPVVISVAIVMFHALVLLGAEPKEPVVSLPSKDFDRGTPDIKSLGALEFGPNGILFIGDSKRAAVFALDLEDNIESQNTEKLEVLDIEGKIAALLGTTPEEILVHDLAVNPISQNAYISVSRGRGKWESAWQTPNELADAGILLRITPEAKIEEVKLRMVLFQKATLPNPVDMNAKHPWKEGAPRRADAITDLAYSEGQLFVAGLSNEEFSSTMWKIDFPFEGEATFTSLEIFHGAHGAYETNSPIRTFLPYRVDDTPHLLAAYLCTPLVTFPVADLKDGGHLKGKTVAEFGSGNFPLDMVVYQRNGKDFILVSNSALPMLSFDPLDVQKQVQGITEKPQAYTAGVPYTVRPGTGIQQLDNYNANFVLALQRSPGGKLDLRSLPVKWL